MLLIVVLVFLITLKTSRALAFIDSESRDDNRQALLAMAGRSSIPWQVCNLVVLINSSVNMQIYCFKDQQFRNVAIQITRLDQVCGRQVTSEMPFQGKDTKKDTEDIEMQTKLT